MRALVTGCAGFIGSHLAEALLRAGHEVVGVDVRADRRAANLATAREWEAFACVRADLAEDPVDPLVDGCDVVFHLAGEPGADAPAAACLRGNVATTRRVLAAAARLGARVVLASSSSVYGQVARRPTPEAAVPAPRTPYGASKLAAERLCGAYGRATGLEVVVLRYFSVYGPRQRPDMAFARFIAAALDGRPLQLAGDGRQTRDFTHVDDAVAATVAAATAPAAAGRTVNVGAGEAASLRDALAWLERLAGRRLPVLRAPARRGDVRDTLADVYAARSLLGWRPAIGLADGLAGQWAWAAASVAAAGAPRTATPEPRRHRRPISLHAP
jgi:nucleoside-diphosphate-sugar epimerase